MLIPSNYYDGYDTLIYEYPWIVPEAIVKIEEYLKPHHKVVEFGSGGSTIFFARRALSVVSHECNVDWYYKVANDIKTKGISNVSLNLIKNIPEWTLIRGVFDVALVDNTHYSRDEIFKHVLTQMAEHCMVIVDNYADQGPLDKYAGTGWTIKTYDDVHWSGRGTKIYVR